MKYLKGSLKLFLLIFAIILSSNSCKDIGKVIVIKSISAENKTSTGVELYAKIIDVGETGLNAYGWCWSKKQRPTIMDSTLNIGSRNQAGEFSTLVTGLDPGTTYYARPFASGGGETVYGEDLTIETDELIFTVSSPKNGDILGYGLTYQIEWTANISDDLKIELYKSTTLAETIDSKEPNSGSYNWTVPNHLAEADDYHILISSVKNSNVKAASGIFTIVAEAPPAVTTDGSEDITYNSATVTGTIVNFGTENSATQHGHCWSLNPNPTIVDDKSELGQRNSVGSFSSNLTGLEANKTYYVRAYATNSVGTNYGEEISFITIELPVPEITTNSVTNISYTSATSGGNILADNGHSVTARGVCWSTSQNPTLADNFTEDGTGTGTFSSNITGLATNTTYYVRAYATNSIGTAYGNEQTFTSLEAAVPTITTTAPTNISYTTANSGGEVSNDNGSAVTALGVCWSTSTNPTIANNNTSDGTGTGTFTSSLTGLTDNTTYYIRAYATNSAGTSYGQQETLTTLEASPSVTTNTVSAISYYTATCGGEVLTEGSSNVTARGVCWSTSSNPTIADSQTSDGTGTGTFTSSLTSLEENTTYYVRAYATNSTETVYGEERSFTTLLASATITTDAVTEISYTTATCGGNITDQGASAITSRGVCWGTSPNPTIADNITDDGTGTGIFTSSLTGLTDNTTYYVRAYATNSITTAYGDEETFTTVEIPTSLTDYDGNTYSVVLIGNQVWMAENLKVTHYPNGDPIPNVTGNSSWDLLGNNNADDAYCFYDNNSGSVYGALYTYSAAIADDWTRDNVSNQGVCPDGWHLPNDEEWKELEMYLGMSQSEADVVGLFRGTNEGSKLAGNAALWTDGALDGNISFGTTGFMGLPSGWRRNPPGDFADSGSRSYWWVADEYSATGAYTRHLDYTETGIFRASGDKGIGFSVRCVKD